MITQSCLRPLYVTVNVNDIFVSKASVQGSDDPVPVLEPIAFISSALSSINTSPIEVSKVLRQLKNQIFLIVVFLVVL